MIQLRSGELACWTYSHYRSYFSYIKNTPIPYTCIREGIIPLATIGNG